MSFCPMIQIEQSDDTIVEATQTIIYLCESGKSGRFYHLVENSGKQWDILCALEDALIANRLNEGWVIVVGELQDDDEVKGWLVKDGYFVIPLGPEAKKSGTDVLVLNYYDFLALNPRIMASCDACDESGIILNKQMKEQFYIDPDKSLGE